MTARRLLLVLFASLAACGGAPLGKNGAPPAAPAAPEGGSDVGSAGEAAIEKTETSAPDAGVPDGEVNVTAPLLSVAVTPASPIVAEGSKVQFTAIATFADNTTRNVTDSATWASAAPATATISNDTGSVGQAAAIAEGTTVISATLAGGIKGATTLTVTSAAATLVSIGVTPSTPSTGLGTTLRFVATGTFSDGTPKDVSKTVTWASATAAVATISNAADSAGVATAIARGTTVITATSGAISGRTTLTVNTAKPVSIVVTPVMPAIATGTKAQFAATAFDNDGTVHDVTLTATWASATTAVATISNDDASRGQASALAVGTTAISATLGLISGNTTLTVYADESSPHAPP